MSDYVNPRAHACQNCVKAKAKCYDLTDGRCERYGFVQSPAAMALTLRGLYIGVNASISTA
jgi:hypothetical protein